MSGIYADLDPVEANSCAMKLVAVLKASTLEPIGMAINASIFKTLSVNERRWMTSAVLYGKDWPSQGSPNHPYFSCFHYCILEANRFTPEGEKVYLTFDRQETYAGNAQKIYNELKDKVGGKWGYQLGDSIVFSSKKEAVLLQAADLIAYSIGRSLNTGKRNDVVQAVLNELAYGKAYVRSMDIKSIDVHLLTCPFRTTFWKGSGFSEPDLIEQLAEQGHNLLTIKVDRGLYLTHHLKAEKIKTISTIVPRPVGDLNLTDRRDDSTK